MRRPLPGLLVLAALGCQSPPAPARIESSTLASSQRARHVALRLRPGQDLARELRRVVAEQELGAAAVVSCVGSLTAVTLRYANQEQGTRLEGHFEIVSLVGTLGPDGAHLHLVASDGEGRCYGGHLLDGSAVYTTAEVVLVDLDDLRFGREHEPLSGYRELAIEARPGR